MAADSTVAKFWQQGDVDQKQFIGGSCDQFATNRLTVQLEYAVVSAREIQRIVMLLSFELHSTEGSTLVKRKSRAFEFVSARARVQTSQEFMIVRPRWADLVVG